MIREYKEIKKDDKTIVVKEMTVEEIEMLIPLFEEIVELEEEIPDKEMVKFIQEHFGIFKDVLKRCVEPDISEIGVSSMLEVIKIFWEVNKNFFVQIKNLLPT
ncbi:hypothetical protein SAMN04488516_11736 [Desulfonauticus submarinus]|uniref:Uncharacterized protein n=1 Tax=Desulfonauticus submarinus TaxID=206665 RepID=A0A1H0GBP4_9BACT|nr:hypothetical protein [Desulfonauticus submarinus]SDO04286.1 hypothetical protein SAMN04488516_11736 [Desulfonauticus submarinus]